MRQNKAFKMAVLNAGGTIGVRIFLAHQGWAYWSLRLRTPTTPALGNSPKTRLVLEHQSKRCAFCPILAKFFQKLREFFFQLS